MASKNSLFLFLLFFFFLAWITQAQDVEFIFNGFKDENLRKNVTLDEASFFKPDGLLRLTNRTPNAIGHAFYSQEIRMEKRDSSSNSSRIASFSTTFVFAIVRSRSTEGGHGLAFVFGPSKHFPGAAPGHFLGLMNNTTNGQPTNHIFAVEFDTVRGFKSESNSKGNHVGVNINDMESAEMESAEYTKLENGRKEELPLDSGQPIQAWIDYDGVNKVLNVTVAPINHGKPTVPLIHNDTMDLTDVMRDTMFVGFSAATGPEKGEASSHYIMGWSFSMKGGEAPHLNLSMLPLPPTEKDSPPLRSSVIGLIAALCAVTVLLFGLFVLVMVKKRAWWRHERLEDWELDCPHRFHFRDLYLATRGFKNSEIIGVGGFGTVYKAVLPSSGNEVAVKKITRNNSLQGFREFAAEIESLGRLRHKHLVNLQGWCKNKNDLLVVYDYVPNGSLDSLLFNPKNNHVLSWKHRFNIVRGIAAGLLYLHEEWEQVVVHRDIKSSNVLIDADMNGKLGDFGLARLYDHGAMSHTTNVVGTVGYIAPELARTGKASASSDVYAYGVLLLEVACGRRPIHSNFFVLVDWVMEHQKQGTILNASDPKLNSGYDEEEMELVLKLGLQCSHPREEARPTMRQVVRFLNRDEEVPEFVDWGSIDSQLRLTPMRSSILEVIGNDTSGTLYISSSVSAMSMTSIDSGR